MSRSTFGRCLRFGLDAVAWLDRLLAPLYRVGQANIAFRLHQLDVDAWGEGEPDDGNPAPCPALVEITSRQPSPVPRPGVRAR